MSPTFGIRRAPWREALRPATDRPAAGLRLVGPAGVLSDRLELAAQPMRRIRGLLGRDITQGGALVLAPCSQIHTFGMRYAIDAVFCDRDLTVLASITVEPSRMTRPVRGAWCCIELPAGSAERAGLKPGVSVRVERVPADGAS